jgi:hypothetical protein
MSEQTADLRKYRIELPNLIDDMDLSVYAFRLYVHLRRRAGAAADGYCAESQRELATACKMSRGAVQDALEELMKAELICVEKSKYGKSSPDRITLSDLWARNYKTFSGQSVDATRSTVDATRSTVDATRSTMDATRSTVDATRSTMDATRSTMDATRSTVDATRSTMDATRSTVDATRSTIEERTIEVTSKEKTKEEEYRADAPPLPAKTQPDNEPQPEPKPAPAKTTPAKRKPLMVTLPEGWEPSASLLAWAADKFPTVDAADETERFIDRVTRDGAVYADWDAAWRTTIRNAHRYTGERAARGGYGSGQGAPTRRLTTTEARQEEELARIREKADRIRSRIPSDEPMQSAPRSLAPPPMQAMPHRRN